MKRFFLAIVMAGLAVSGQAGETYRGIGGMLRLQLDGDAAAASVRMSYERTRLDRLSLLVQCVYDFRKPVDFWRYHSANLASGLVFYPFSDVERGPYVVATTGPVLAVETGYIGGLPADDAPIVTSLVEMRMGAGWKVRVFQDVLVRFEVYGGLTPWRRMSDSC